MALVEVDGATCEVKTLRYVVVEDCGRMVNPLIVDGQVHGGVAQGIGAALLYLHGGGFSACEIGVKLKHATTTISREIRRNQATRPSTRRGRTATAVRSATSAVLSSV